MDSWKPGPAEYFQTSQTHSIGDRTSADGVTDSTSPNANRSNLPTESPSGIATSATPGVRRRNRNITSCLECRKRKLRCDRQMPCVHCTRHHRDCLYLDAQSQQKLTEIKEKMGMLERNLQRKVASQSQKQEVQLASEGPLLHDDGDEDEVNVEDDDLEPTPVAAWDNVFEDNTDDELMDLGVQMGKLRIPERVGGCIHPRLADEVTHAMQGMRAGTLDSWIMPPLERHLGVHSGAGTNSQVTPKIYVAPGADYIAPTSGIFFPGTNSSTSLSDYLPRKQVADQLISQYWHAVHYLCKIVHRPTFEAQYTTFWSQITAGSDVSPSIQPIVFAAVFSAAVSMTPEQVLQKFGTSKEALVSSLQSGTEFVLAKANFLKTTKLDTMQGFVMYLIPLVRADVSRTHTALVGAAIRLAECMALHRDGTQFGMTPIEVQVRRMIWYQLCLLDMRTSDATGPRPQIRADDYSTRKPWNVDDWELMGDDPTTEDRCHWTDATFVRISAECHAMRVKVWYDIIAVDKKRKSLTSVLVEVQKFIDATEKRYLPMMDESKPFQRLARLMLEAVTRTMYLQLLHRYLFNHTQQMPDRLRQVLLEAALKQIEASVEWERSPRLAPWVWYRGTFNQYNASLLLLIEVYTFPMRKEAARIWNCLDYIFEISSQLPPKQKAELILGGLGDRLVIFQQMRKMKSSYQLQQKLDEESRRESRTTSATYEATGHNQQQNAATMRHDCYLGSDGSNQSNIADVQYQNLHLQSTYQGPPMQEIDWTEWEQAFNPAIYTGDLNAPDFDMADFTGSVFTGSSVDGYAFGSMAASTIGNTNNSNFAVSQAVKSFHPLNAIHATDLNFGVQNGLNPAFVGRPEYRQEQWREMYGSSGNNQYQQ